MARVRRIILAALAMLTLSLGGVLGGSAAGTVVLADGGPPFQCPYC